jgi:hypothetical protein
MDKKFLDEEARDILEKIYNILEDKLEVGAKVYGAIQRIKNCIKQGTHGNKEILKGQIFKAAGELGIRV